MEYESTATDSDFVEAVTPEEVVVLDDDVDEPTKQQRKFFARRKIEDLREFKRMKEELGWMDDFETEFGEVY